MISRSCSDNGGGEITYPTWQGEDVKTIYTSKKVAQLYSVDIYTGPENFYNSKKIFEPGNILDLKIQNKTNTKNKTKQNKTKQNKIKWDKIR